MQAEIERRIGELELAKRSFSEPDVVLALLASLDRIDASARSDRSDGSDRSGSGEWNAALLARFHDALLFLCAYPATPKILKRAESILGRFSRRVVALAHVEDLSPLLDQRFSGIAGTSIATDFSYDVARWLVQRFPGHVGIDSEADAASDRLASILPSLFPFLDELSADANIPYREWLAAADPGAGDGGLAWLLGAIEGLLIPLAQRAALYDSLGLVIDWRLGNSAMTRTRMRRLPPEIFYQQTPLLSRRDVEQMRQLRHEPLPVRRLSRWEGEEVLDLARAVITTRYRELYCFSWGDPAGIQSVNGGRGLEILLIGLLPEHRLPLRAGFGVLVLRNGVPIGYGDAYGLCERMEVSFNIFYAFRDGESAFCFIRLLEIYHQLFGSTSFSIDPYQIGLGNDEAIEAGAFWFYRKLGFRSTDPLIERTAVREEQRMAADPRHRTSPRTLKKWAVSNLVLDLNDEEIDAPRRSRSRLVRHARGGDWDRFQVRNLGTKVGKAFAARGESAAAFRDSTTKRIAASLRIDVGSLTFSERRAFDRLAPVLALIPDLTRWTDDERSGLLEIVRVKTGRSEGKYLQLTADHERLRRALIALGR